MDGRETTSLPSTVAALIGFVGGCIVSGLTTYFVTRKIERKKADAEVKDVIDRIQSYVFTNFETQSKNEADPANTGVISNDAVHVKNPAVKESVTSRKELSVIRMEEFVEDDEYDKETLIYYNDNEILTDQYDNVLNVNDVIGEEALKHFGEEEEDIVYVRNERLKTDYEVILEHQSSPPSALAEGDEDDD